jgi:glycosyltransferase involved in cell wall biosynthesis
VNDRGVRRRVVHVVVAGDIGGAERLLVDLASRPDASRAEHSIALMTPNRALARLFQDAGLRVHDRGPVRENPLAYLWRSLGPSDTAWLEGVLREERANVVHLHTFASHVVGTRAARRAGVPVIRTEHHIAYFTDPSCAPFTRWSLRRVDATVAISDYVARFVEKTMRGIGDRMHVVRNGVDTDYFVPRTTERSAEDPFTFVVACRLEAWKGVDLVVDAMARVDGARLVVVGDGAERERLEASARSLGVSDHVVFAGYERDPRARIAAADAAVNSSRDEPLGLSILEALSMAKPVVAFYGGGVPEIVKDGETGWLVRERTVAALADRMREAARDRGQAATMGAAGRRFAVEECDVRVMCEGYGKVYDAVLARAANVTVRDAG